MASRYPTIKVVDYCYHPLRVYDKDLDKDIIVPCGRCDGCLLHKANQWSMRCGMEIEGSPATIFGSLTYSNKYYPKLYPVVGNGSLPNTLTYLPHGLDSVLWVSDHKDNIRFNGVRDVPREDNIILKSSYDFPVEPIKISHWDNFNFPAVGYASKRDIQLWLKLLRRYLDEKISYKDKRVLERGFFRYFIISEYGPTTLRGHYHFLIFCNFREIRFGIRAAYKIFLAYRSRGIVTYEQIIIAFAPYVENPTASYIRYVCEKCCVDSWDKPSSTEDFATLIYYMWCFEQGSKRPPTLTIAQIEEIISDYDFITG